MQLNHTCCCGLAERRIFRSADEIAYSPPLVIYNVDVIAGNCQSTNCVRTAVLTYPSNPPLSLWTPQFLTGSTLSPARCGTAGSR
jgi:hypothetical protein